MWLCVTGYGTFNWWEIEVNCDLNSPDCAYIPCPFDHNYFCHKSKCSPDLKSCSFDAREYDQVENMIAEIGFEFGWLCVIDWIVLFLSISKICSFFEILQISSDQLISLHRFLGHASLVQLQLHALLYFIVWIKRENLWEEMLKWPSKGVANFPGVLSWILFSVLWILSIERVRRKFYHIFYIFHWLYLPSLVLAIFHYDAILFWTLGGLGVYFIDKLVIQRKSACLSSLEICENSKSIAIDIDFAHLNDDRVFPLQYYFLRFPRISMEWHPFSVASYDSDLGTLRFYIKCVNGGWTSDIFEKALKNVRGESDDNYLNRVEVQGPVGFKFESEDILQVEDNIILIAGGSGIVPFFDLLKSLYASNKKERKRRVKLVWLSKTHNEVLFFGQFLNTLNSQNTSFQVDIYETQETSDSLALSSREIKVLVYPVVHGKYPTFQFGKYRVILLILLFLLAAIFSSYISNLLMENSSSKGALNVYMGLFFMMNIIVFSVVYLLTIRYFEKSREIGLISPSTQRSPSEYYEAVTHSLSLKIPVNFGRPDFKCIVHDFQAIDDMPTIILSSGPTGLLDAIEFSCKSLKYLKFKRISFEF
jgi:NAD(P)H-flavin reductase